MRIIKFEKFNENVSWTEIIKNDFGTYPEEGIEVLVTDGIHYDVAYYIMSGEYKWVKKDLIKDDINDFISFPISKWSYIYIYKNKFTSNENNKI